VEKPVVVHEKIMPSQRTEVQPVIHRDREQVEVHKVVQPLRERDIAPTQHQYMQLPAENYQSRASDTDFQNQYRDVNERIHPECFTAPMTTEQVQRAPIIEETVHKKIIEEIQPVLYRETFRPVVVEATRPIFERVVEAPRLVEEILPMRDLGTKILGAMGGEMPREAPQSTGMQGGPSTYIHEKVTVITKEYPGQNLTGQTTGQNWTGQNLTGQTTGQNLTGQTTGQNLTGQNATGQNQQQFLPQKTPLATEGMKLAPTTTPTEAKTI